MAFKRFELDGRISSLTCWHIFAGMNHGKYVSAQVMSFLDPNDFSKCVKKYAHNYKIRHFTYWHQLMCLVFGQLSNREA